MSIFLISVVPNIAESGGMKQTAGVLSIHLVIWVINRLGGAVNRRNKGKYLGIL